MKRFSPLPLPQRNTDHSPKSVSILDLSDQSLPALEQSLFTARYSKSPRTPCHSQKSGSVPGWAEAASPGRSGTSNTLKRSKWSGLPMIVALGCINATGQSHD
jgi:hypothetical protein